MSGTVQYLKHSRKQARDMAVLVRISPRDPVTLGTTDMHFSTAVVSTPAGGVFDPIVWQPRVIEIGSISSPGAFGETDLELCSCTIVLDEGAINPVLFLLDNAPVSVWLWERSLASADDMLCVLSNARVLAWAIDGDTLTLEVRQRTEWNNDIVPVEVTSDVFPYAPDDSLGQRIPVVYGSHRDVPLRPPWAEYPQVEDQTATTVYRGLPLAIGGRRVGAAVLVDTGRGNDVDLFAKAKVLCASHKVKKISDHLNGAGMYIVDGENMMAIEVDVADIINTTTEAGITLPDDSPYAWLAVRPVDVALFTNSAENPRAVLDTYNDNNYSKLDWSASYRFLHVHYPALSEELGEMAEVYVMVAYRSPAHTNMVLRLYKEPYTSGFTDFALPVSANRIVWMKRWATGPTWGTGLVGNDLPTRPYAFTQVNMEIGWPEFPSLVTGTGTAEVFFCGFVVKFKPRQSILASERVIEYRNTIPAIRFQTAPGKTWSPYTIRATLPAVQELRGKFYANVDGYGDDGEFSAAAGDFTGTANALIERGPDILAHMLVRYGAEDISKLERSGGYGDFIAARTKLQTPRKQDMRFALSIAETADMRTAITWMSQATVSLVILDRFTDTWRILPWRTDLPVDYDWTFRPNDIVEGSSLKVERTPLGNVMTGLTLGYSRTADQNTMQHRTRLAWDGSDAGFKYRDVRDAYETVVTGVNDRLDFVTTAAFAANLTPNAYDPPSFGQMVAAAMKTANSAQEFCVSWGPSIVSGYNDSMAFFDTPHSVEKTIAIQTGTYASWEDFCTYLSGVLSAETGVTVTCSFTRATKLFRIVIASSSIVLHNNSGTNWASRRFYATLGFALAGSDLIVTGPATNANSQRDEETFAVTCLTTNLTLPWETGTNGINGLRRNAAGLLGFVGIRDSNVASTRSYLADSPKSNAEAGLLQTAQRYGARRDTVEDLRAVLDTDTAREVRNRVVQLMGKPRIIVMFSTDMAHDIERGRVIQFSADFDAVLPYPDPDSDGSWLDKRFIVVETEQMLGPVAFYIKIRAVSLD